MNRLRLMVAFLMVTCLVISAAPAKASGTRPVRVVINGRELSVPEGEPGPFVDVASNRTLVPMRAVLEALGARLEWNGASRTATARNALHAVTVTIDDTRAIVDGTPRTLDTPARLVQSRILLPLRFTAESLGASVTWDQSSYTAIITMPSLSVTSEQFVRDLLTVQYARPAALDQSTFPYLKSLHDTRIPEVTNELGRLMTDIREEYQVAQTDGLQFRRSDVRIQIRAQSSNGATARIEASVNSSLYWGYPGGPDEKPMETFNYHEFLLRRTGGSWLVEADRNLASAVKPRITAPPALAGGPAGSGISFTGDNGGGGGDGGGNGSSWRYITCDTERCTYDRENAVAYALNFYRDGNSDFVNYGDTEAGDCTNFTSQALFAGGLPLYPTQLQDEWWYDQADDTHSWVWGVADGQAHWMRTHYGDYLRDADGAAVNLIISPDRASDLSLGDVIYYDWKEHGEWSWWCFCYPLRDGDENFDHSAIVTGFDSKNEPLVTYRNAVGGKPGRNRYWKLSSPKHLVYGLHLYNEVDHP